MLAYHGDQEFRAAIIAQLQDHADADELIQGTGWKNGKGCFVGCILHRYDHSFGPEAIGWPENLLRLADSIFEGLPNGDAKKFALDLPNAVRAGADLSSAVDRFSLWLLKESGLRENAFDDGKAAIDAVITLLQRQVAGDIPTEDEWSAAESAAWAAARSAESAAWAAARSAARSVESAAWQCYAEKLLEIAADAPVSPQAL